MKDFIDAQTKNAIATSNVNVLITNLRDQLEHPSNENWSKIKYLLDLWSAHPSLEIAISYLCDHLNKWEDKDRYFDITCPLAATFYETDGVKVHPAFKIVKTGILSDFDFWMTRPNNSQWTSHLTTMIFHSPHTYWTEDAISTFNNWSQFKNVKTFELHVKEDISGKNIDCLFSSMIVIDIDHLLIKGFNLSTTLITFLSKLLNFLSNLHTFELQLTSRKQSKTELKALKECFYGDHVESVEFKWLDNPLSVKVKYKKSLLSSK